MGKISKTKFLLNTKKNSSIEKVSEFPKKL